MNDLPLVQTSPLEHPGVDQEADTMLLYAVAGPGACVVALLAACLATAGSLFFSEVLGWMPCTLCWYQRILMYPLSVVIAIGVLRRDAMLPAYVLPFSVSGVGVALYHYLLIKTDWFPPPPCRAGVPCTVDYLNIFGFITIPFLALTAFLIITLTMIIAMLAPFATPTDQRRHTGVRALVGSVAWIVYGMIGAVIAAYGIASKLV